MLIAAIRRFSLDKFITLWHNQTQLKLPILLSSWMQKRPLKKPATVLNSHSNEESKKKKNNHTHAL